MSAFFLTFLATALAIVCGRESIRVARLAAARAGSLALVPAILAAGFAQAAIAASLAGELGKLLTPETRPLIVAIALAVAGAEVLVLRAAPRPREPTFSIGATVLVLFAELVTGAAGLLVLALGVATAVPVLAGAGGALGAMAALGAAMLAREDWEKLPHGAMRLIGGGLLMLAALAAAVSAL